MAGFRAELIVHCGGNPDARQRVLIEVVAQTRLKLAILDARTASGAVLSMRERSEYVRLVNALNRALQGIGPAATERQPTLAEILAQPVTSARETVPEREVA